MNEYDDILNRIVEEFYDTGKVVLSELDLPDELQGHSSEQQTQLKRELSQNLITAKRTFQSASYKSSKENYENFLNNVENLTDKTEFEIEIENANERLLFIGNLLKHKETEEEETSFEKSIEDIETQDITPDFYKKIIIADEKNILGAFEENLCLYGELINGNPYLRKLIMDSFTSDYCNESNTDKCISSDSNPLINQIRGSENLSDKDKKALKTILRVGPSEFEKRTGCEDETPENIINKYVTTFDSKKRDVEKELPEDSILNKNIENKLKKCYGIIQSIMVEMSNNNVIQQTSKTKNIFSDLMNSIVTYTKGAGENKSLTTKVQKDIEGSLNMIIYDLYQLLLTIQSYDVYDTTQKEEIKSIINNISIQVNNKEKLSENFFVIRQIRNQKYEDSFECNEKYFFEKTTGGNSPKIISVTKNNQYLTELITGATETPFLAKNIATKIYNQIDGEKITESLEKHDIKSNRKIVLENGITIPKDSKIEVKLTSRYSDYHLSEFFGVYKNKPLDEHTDTYNQVITELKKMLKGDDKGIIQKIRDTTAGIFYENYMYTPIENVKIEWSDMGQRPTEKRLSLRVTVENESKISQWTKQNGNCNCEPFLKGVDCPQNESTDRLDGIIENFFDTGKFVI